MADAYRLAREVLPPGQKRLYKFRAFDRAHPEHLSRIFTHGELYFPSPSQLNDPFEFKPWIQPPPLVTWADKRRAFKAAKEMELRYGLPKKEAKRRARYAKDHGFMEKKAAEMTAELPREMEAYRLCSFCKHWDSLLLWSHYAGAHTGICIGFDADNDELGSAMEVEYSEEYPAVGFFDRDADALLKKMALTKSTVWKYENEFRLLAKHPPIRPMLPVRDHIYGFDRRQLKEVILGCAISPENERDVRAWVAGFGSPVELVRARRLPTRYGLEFDA